jgi:hypothetical protein
LTVDDIPYNPPREVDEQSPAPASRLTLQHFIGDHLLGPMLSLHAPRNSDARQPEDTSEWLPAIIVDILYACAALKAWGSKPFTDFVRERSKSFYYEDADGSDMHLCDQGTERSQRYLARNENKMRPASSVGPPQDMCLSDLLDGVAALWMRSSREGKRKLQDDGVSDLVHKEDSIKKWLESTAESIS